MAFQEVQSSHVGQALQVLPRVTESFGSHPGSIYAVDLARPAVRFAGARSVFYGRFSAGLSGLRGEIHTKYIFINYMQIYIGVGWG